MKSLFKIILTIVVCFSSNSTIAGDSDFYIKNREFISPLHWHYEDYANEKLELIISGENEHPLMLGATAIFYFSEYLITGNEEFKDKGVKVINVIDNYPYTRIKGNSTLYMYNQDHDEMKAQKWWSGMANSSIALAYVYAYKATGDIDYKNKSFSAFNGVINPISENGSAIIMGDDSAWYLEYADDNSNSGNSYFVLNGFLYAVIVSKIMGEQFPEIDMYRKSYQKGINAFLNLSDGFYYPNDKWTYYMLNPLIVESPHYAVYDHLLVSILTKYDERNREALNAELNRRSNVFLKSYPIEKKQNGDLVFSAVGVPHPYWIDIYPTTLKLVYQDGSFIEKSISPTDRKKTVSSRAFARVLNEDTKGLVSIEVYQEYANRVSKLYQVDYDDITMVDYESLATQKLEHKISAWGDLDENGKVKLYKGRDSKVIVQAVFNEPENLWEYKYFYTFLNSDLDIDAIKLLMIDVDGNSTSRYYLPQGKGDNLILLSALGFKEQENIKHQIKEVRFYLYYNKNDNVKEASVELDDIYFINSNSYLDKLLSEGVKPEENEGFNFSIKGDKR